jgi:membrane protein DedA with SNARE-associated domain
MNFDGIGDAIVTFVRDHKAWAAPIVFVLAFGESLAFVSLILPFWAMLVGIGTIVGTASAAFWLNGDFWLIMTAAAIGAALGDWVSYWLGRHYHAEIAQMWPLSKHPDLLPKGRAFFESWGAWAIVLGRFSGPLRASVPIIAGAVQMNRTKFQVANWLSAFLWAFVLLVFGDALGKVWIYLDGRFGLADMNTGTKLAWGGGATVVLLGLLWVLKKAFTSRGDAQ